MYVLQLSIFFYDLLYEKTITVKTSGRTSANVGVRRYKQDWWFLNVMNTISWSVKVAKS